MTDSLKDTYKLPNPLIPIDLAVFDPVLENIQSPGSCPRSGRDGYSETNAHVLSHMNMSSHTCLSCMRRCASCGCRAVGRSSHKCTGTEPWKGPDAPRLGNA